MTTSRRLLPLAGTLFLLILGLAAAGASARTVSAVVVCLAIVAVLAVTTGLREVTTAVDAMPTLEGAKTPQAIARAWLSRTFGALEDSHFRMFYLGNVLQFGCMNMQLVVRGWLVFHLTGSFAALGTMALANAIPVLVCSPIGGVVADRAPKKLVIQASQTYNVLNAVMLVILAAGWFGLRLEFWHLFLSAFLQGAVNSMAQPSRQSMISDLVPRERLMNAVGINASGQTFMQLVAPGLAGFLIAAVSPAAVFAVISTMYLLAILCTTRLPSKPLYAFVPSAVAAGGGHGPGPGRRRGGGGFADLVAGMKYVGTSRTIRGIMLVNFMIVIVSLPYTQLLPGFVAAVLHRGSVEQGFLQSVQGFGAIGGAVFIASSASVGRGRLLLMCGAMLGGAILLFSMSTIYLLTLPIMVFLGFAQSSRMAIGQVLIQEYSEDEYRGRVASIWFMEFGIVQFGTFLVGLLAQAFGPQLAIGGMALGLMAAMGLAFLFMPSIRNLE